MGYLGQGILDTHQRAWWRSRHPLPLGNLAAIGLPFDHPVPTLFLYDSTGFRSWRRGTAQRVSP